MKRNSTLLLFLSLQFFAQAQTLPTNLACGSATRDWIKTNYFDSQIRTSTISYNSARQYMYAYVDNTGTSLKDVYGGLVYNYTPSPLPGPFQTPPIALQTTAQSGWATSLPGGSATLIINCEHTIPQSFFSQNLPMRGDIHHLFPAYEQWNNDRNNYRFSDIPDAQTTKWETQQTSQSTIPTTNIDEYSELGKVGTETVYEPREDHKGKVARAVLYFFTVYPTQAGAITTVAELATLKKWHEDHPPTAADIERNNRIEQAQGNRNPFVDHPSWIYQAWCLSAPIPIEFVNIKARFFEKQNHIEWTVNELNIDHYTLERSADGVNWTTAADVKPLSKNGINDYKIEDNSPFTLTFYRVKAYELDGTSKFSKIVSADRAGKGLTIDRLFPNTDAQTLMLEVTSGRNEEATVEIFDAAGRQVSARKMSLWDGTNALNVPTVGLANGLYVVRITRGLETASQKFEKF